MLTLPDTLTLNQATAWLGGLPKALQAQGTSVFEVDASQLQTFDSAALAVLLECRRQAAVQSKSMQVQGMPPRLRDLAQLYGVSDLLPDSAVKAA